MTAQPRRIGRDCHRAVTSAFDREGIYEVQQRAAAVGGLQVEVVACGRPTVERVPAGRMRSDYLPADDPAFPADAPAGRQVGWLRSAIETLLVLAAVAAVFFGGDFLFGERLP